MKFTPTSEHLYWWPVKVRLPNPDPRRAGQFIEQSFKAQFAGIPVSEAKALLEEIQKLPEDQQQDRQNDHLKRVLRGWNEEVLGEDEQPIAFSTEAVELVLDNTWALTALYRAWSASLGQDRLGN